MISMQVNSVVWGLPPKAYTVSPDPSPITATSAGFGWLEAVHPEDRARVLVEIGDERRVADVAVHEREPLVAVHRGAERPAEHEAEVASLVAPLLEEGAPGLVVFSGRNRVGGVVEVTVAQEHRVRRRTGMQPPVPRRTAPYRYDDAVARCGTHPPARTVNGDRYRSGASFLPRGTPSPC